MPELFDYEFMRRALLAALVTGLTAPAIGTFIVQRRLALLGDGIGHVALAGVALGLLTGTAPLLTALIVAAIGAVVIELLRTYAKTSGDVALAMLFYGGLAAGVLLINVAGSSASTLASYLFGSILTVSPSDQWVVVGLGAAILIITFALTPQLFAMCQDEDHARVSGVPVRLYGIVLAIMAAVTVTVAMRTVGLLLVSALMVVPVAAAQQVARSFRATHVLAMAIGVFSAVAGLGASWRLSTQPGPTIVLITLVLFVVLAASRGGLDWVGRVGKRRVSV